MKYINRIDEFFKFLNKGKKSVKTEFVDKVGKTIVDPLDFIASSVLLSNRTKHLTEKQFHQYLNKCEEIIKRDGYITDYELIGVGVVANYLENKPTGCESRICKLYDYVLLKKLQGDTNFYKA